MTSFVGSSSGVSQVANTVVQAYTLKTYTEKEYQVIVDGSKSTAPDLDALIQAYSFFKAMEQGTAYNVPGGATVDGKTVVDFSIYQGTQIGTTLCTQVQTLLKSFDKVEIENPSENPPTHDLPLCVNQNGSDDNGNPGAHISLYDLIINPNENVIAEYKGSSDLHNTDYAPAGSAGNDISNQGGGSSWGAGIATSENVNSVTGITVHCHQESCSSNTCVDVSGKASDFEKYAQVSSSDPGATQAAFDKLDQTIAGL